MFPLFTITPAEPPVTAVFVQAPAPDFFMRESVVFKSLKQKRRKKESCVGGNRKWVVIETETK